MITIIVLSKIAFYIVLNTSLYHGQVTASLYKKNFVPSMNKYQRTLRNSIQYNARFVESSPNPQLPDSILPIHYDLQIEPNMTEPHPFTGYVKIKMKILKPTSSIVLNMKGLIVDNFIIKEHTMKNHFNRQLISDGDTHYSDRLVQITDTYYIESHEMIEITTEEELHVGKMYSLEMTYSGYIRTDMMGFYKSPYIGKNNNEKFMFVTQFQMTDARSAFPCFDQPNFKSIFSVVICRPPNITSISNMPLQSTVKRPDRKNIYCDVFEPTVNIPTYLLAFAVTEYKSKKCNASSVPMQIYGPDSDLESYEYACKISTEILEFFETFTGIRYALPKIDLLSVKEIFAYGMENYGLLTFRDELLIVNKSAPNVAEQEIRSTKIIAHELAHQWFGNLVTTPSWSTIWLYEGLATYLAYVASDKVRPDLLMMRWFYMEAEQLALEHDATDMTRPLSDSNIDLADVISIFDGISYWKSSSIIRMLSEILSPRTFQKGLNYFLRNFAYGNAGELELWHHLTTAGHEDQTLPVNLSVQIIMKNWLHNKGYPIVTFKIENGTMESAQRSVFQKIQNNSEVISPLWFVRLNLRSYNINTYTTHNVWIPPEANTVQLPHLTKKHQFYVANSEQVGFYRVNYDEENWMKIIQKITTNHTFFDNITKLQLLDDAFALGNNNLLNYSIAMDMLQLLEYDTSIYPLYIALSHMSTLISFYDNDRIYGSLSKYFGYLLSPHFKHINLSFDKKKTEFERNVDDFTVYYFCKVDPSCVREAKIMFNKYLDTKESLIKETMVETILCIGIAEGGIREWEKLWKRFIKTPIKNLHLGKALACSRHQWILNIYLDKLSKWKIHDALLLEIFESMAENPFGINFIWDKIREFWSVNYKTNYFSKVKEEGLKRILPHFRNYQQHKDVIAFLLEKKVDFAKYTDPINILEEKLQFHEDNYEELSFWANKKYV